MIYFAFFETEKCDMHNEAWVQLVAKFSFCESLLRFPILKLATTFFGVKTSYHIDPSARYVSTYDCHQEQLHDCMRCTYDSK
jgi:hypothetical protein